MPHASVQAQVRAVVPTSGGCAIFLGNDDKVFVIYVDQSVGAAINLAMRKTPRERPQTHDLIGDILTAVGAKVSRIVINDFDDGVFFARLILEIENELEERKIMEIDARPSDSIALAVAADAPIFVSQNVWDGADDMTEILRKMEDRGFEISENDD
ncbi:hypothetical protein BH23VER1_BH23VER1_09120 [soil metagenome]